MATTGGGINTRKECTRERGAHRGGITQGSDIPERNTHKIGIHTGEKYTWGRDTRGSRQEKDTHKGETHTGEGYARKEYIRGKDKYKKVHKEKILTRGEHTRR